MNINNTEEELEKILSEHAEIEKVKLIRHRNNVQNRGFGFITVKDHAEALKITENEIIIDGKKVDTYIARSRKTVRDMANDDIGRDVL